MLKKKEKDDQSKNQWITTERVTEIPKYKVKIESKDTYRKVKYKKHIGGTYKKENRKKMAKDTCKRSKICTKKVGGWGHVWYMGWICCYSTTTVLYRRRVEHFKRKDAKSDRDEK